MTENKNEVKEIDLLELFRLIGQGIKNGVISLLKAIIFLVVFGIKKAHFLILFVIVGGLVGYGLHSLSRSFYTSGMIIQPNGIPSTDLIEYINDLTSVCKTGNTASLAMVLSIEDSVAKKIKSIEAFPYIDVNGDEIGDYIDFNDKYDPIDTTQQILQNRIFLQVSLFENQSTDFLQKGIVNYISKNKYFLQLNKIRKAELKEQIKQTKIEISKLDSLQNYEYFNSEKATPAPTQSGGYIVYAEKRQHLYYRNKLELIEDKQALEKESEFNNGPITVIKDLSELAVEDNPRGKMIIKFGFWLGVVGYLLLLLINSKAKIIKFSNY